MSDHRFLALDSPLGGDKLKLVSFTGREELSRLFEFQLEMLSDDTAIAGTAVVGKPMTIKVLGPDGGTQRAFNGIVASFAAGDVDERGTRSYRATLVPKLWFLTKNQNCRIFQEKTLKQIADAILGERAITPLQWSAQHTLPTWEYAVQYRESDFDFLSRLFEQEGLFYFFKHEEGQHTLSVADAKSAYKPCSEDSVRYLTGSLVANHVTRWEHRYQFVTGAWSHGDYDYAKPTANLIDKTQTVTPIGDTKKYERFDWPGHTIVKSNITELVKFRMEREEVGWELVEGSSTCPSFTAGSTFTMSEHPSASEEGKKYVLLGVEHSAVDGSFTGAAGASFYQNTFVCMPADRNFRAARSTPKPLISGIQTALVTGPSGEEIYTDKMGRVKVQFPWDREGKKDEKTSCWIRCAQTGAGKGFGSVVLPRIGWEVVVHFIDGDPDRPLITGCVYNGDNAEPYALPDNQTQSGYKSRSSKGGAEDNFNELRFEDKKGAELVYFHAEKDAQRHVEHDDKLFVGNERVIEVDKGKLSTTLNEGEEIRKIKKGNRTTEIDEGDDTFKIAKGDHGFEISEGKRTTKIKGDDALEITDGNSETKVSQGNRTVEISMGDHELKIQMGNQTTKLDLGKSETEAMQGIELKVGQNSIKIDQSGITIKGLMVTLEGQATLEAKSPMTTVKGDGILTLKGGMAMIN